MKPLLDARTAREIGAIFITAVCLGFAYNSASPLGIGKTSGPTGQPAEAAAAAVSIPWSEVKPLLAKGQIILVDARDAHSYKAGHIPGAVSLPFATLRDTIDSFMAGAPKTMPLVIYCASIQCGLAHSEAVALRQRFGYSDVREMPGGYAEWLAAESSDANPKEGGR